MLGAPKSSQEASVSNLSTVSPRGNSSPRHSTCQPGWLAGYTQDDITIPSHFATGTTRWDLEVLEWILSYGSRRLARVDIWDIDWANKRRELGNDIPPAAAGDPRTASERAVHELVGTHAATSRGAAWAATSRSAPPTPSATGSTDTSAPRVVEGPQARTKRSQSRSLQTRTG
jgi:hypothetical protein